VNISYEDDMQFRVTFDNGARSDLVDIPVDGTALVTTKDGSKMAVVALGNHEGPLTPDTLYLLNAASTTVSGDVPTKEDYDMLCDETEDDDEVEIEEDDDEGDDDNDGVEDDEDDDDEEE
jgi:hypothetical protein